MNREPITLRNLLMRARLLNYRKGVFKVDQHVEHHIKSLVKPTYMRYLNSRSSDSRHFHREFSAPEEKLCCYIISYIN